MFALISRQISCRSLVSRCISLPAGALGTRLYNNQHHQEKTLDMIQNLAPSHSAETDQERWAKMSEEARGRASLYPPAGPYAGRSVMVARGKVSEAIRSLDNILKRNKVRQRLRLTQRHEKRGEKLRRLASERWRKQFANEVRQKVQLVTKIRNRGA